MKDLAFSLRAVVSFVEELLQDVSFSPMVEAQVTVSPLMLREWLALRQEAEEALKGGCASMNRDHLWMQTLLSKFPAFDPGWPDAIQEKWWHMFACLADANKQCEEKAREVPA